MNLDLLYSYFLKSTGVTTDSRHCPDGSIFFALKGDNFDGNKYAQQALEKGCAYAVVDDVQLDNNEHFVFVADVLEALQGLALKHRRVLGLPIVGITGSNGKTTTKELLAAVLEQKFNLHYTQGNFNNHIGVPLTILQLKAEHELAIVEMGANHPKEIEELCQICEPNMGVITNIGKAHLEGFGGIEGVINTKKELYDFIRSNGGKLYVNGGDDLLMNLSESVERTLYNCSDAVYGVKVEDILPSLTLRINSNCVDDLLETQLAGEYNRINIAAALEIGNDLGLSYEAMKKGLEAYFPTNNRSQIVDKGDSKIILDAYNANPASMAVAVENFDKIKANSKVVVLGAMKELGRYSKDEHQSLVALLASKSFCRVFVVGEEFNIIDDKPSNVEFFNTLEDVELVLGAVKADLFLIKGSRSMKMERLLEVL